MDKHVPRAFIFGIFCLFQNVLVRAEETMESAIVSREYIGCFEYGFESSEFSRLTQHGSEVWLVKKWPDEDAERIMGIPADAYGVRRMYIKAIAIVGPTGHFGMGMDTREMIIERFVELRPLKQSDGRCGSWPPIIHAKPSASKSSKRDDADASRP